MKNREKKQRQIVVKSNALVSARYKHRYSLHEQKTLLWILAQIQNDKADQNEEYILNVKEYAESLGISPNHIYQEAQSIANRLLSKTLTIKEKNGEWIVCSWLSGMQYKNGQLRVSIYPPLKPHLFELKKHFTSYQLKYTLSLNSVYAIRIYEILVQYLNIGYRVVALEELRQMLGIEENKLKQFGEFKKRVLEIAKREINQKTDITCDWQPIKTGKKITKIKFIIERKDVEPVIKSQLLEVNHVVNDNTLSAKLEKIGFDRKEFLKLEKKFGQKKINEKYEYMLQKKDGIRNQKKWLIKAIVDDYETNDTPKKHVGNSPVRDYEKQRVFSACQQAFFDYQRGVVHSKYKNLSEEEQKPFLQRFKCYLGGIADHFNFDKNIFEENVVVYDKLLDFVMENYPEWLETALSFNEFFETYMENKKVNE